MAPLDREEINAGLKRLGITTLGEREVCIDEYIEYFANYKDTFVNRIIYALKEFFSMKL